jgi:hypothetical protein
MRASAEERICFIEEQNSHAADGVFEDHTSILFRLTNVLPDNHREIDSQKGHLLKSWLCQDKNILLDLRIERGQTYKIHLR